MIKNTIIITFVQGIGNMLLIRVAEVAVILVGLLIHGYSAYEENVFKSYPCSGH